MGGDARAGSLARLPITQGGGGRRQKGQKGQKGQGWQEKEVGGGMMRGGPPRGAWVWGMGVGDGDGQQRAPLRARSRWDDRQTVRVGLAGRGGVGEYVVCGIPARGGGACEHALTVVASILNSLMLVCAMPRGRRVHYERLCLVHPLSSSCRAAGIAALYFRRPLRPFSRRRSRCVCVQQRRAQHRAHMRVHGSQLTGLTQGIPGLFLWSGLIVRDVL